MFPLEMLTEAQSPFHGSISHIPKFLGVTVTSCHTAPGREKLPLEDTEVLQISRLLNVTKTWSLCQNETPSAFPQLLA